jgi:hypothetical protein
MVFAFASVLLTSVLSARLRSPVGCRFAVVLTAAAAVAASLAAPAAAPAIPGSRSLSSVSLVAICGPGPLNGPPCSLAGPPRRNVLLLGLLDWRPDPTDRIGTLSYSFSYDPSLLTFQASQTSLLCELRSAAADPLCPDAVAGSGTAGIGVFAPPYTVDQTGLSIDTSTGSDGLPLVSLNWSGDAVTVSGERNFLALAFDLAVPLNPGATVTYSTDPIADATLTTLSLSCKNDGGSDVDCGSDQPTLALRINNPVPGPLGLGGVAVLLERSRRLRRRLG